MLRDDAQAVLADLRLLRRELLRNPFRDAERSGLTGPQVTVMAQLAEGPQTLTDLARRTGMSHSTASGIIDRLETRGLVERTRDASDARRTAISITEKVARYTRQLTTGSSNRVEEALRRATPEERAVIRKGLALLRDLLRNTRG